MTATSAAHDLLMEARTRTPSAAETRFKARERETRTYLTPGQFGVVRLDGRAFHTYCRGLVQPADTLFMAHMDLVAVALTKQLSGVRLAYVQSDELSLIFSDWRTLTGDEPATNTEFMFGGAVQKLVSIAAAIASTTLNIHRLGTVTDQVALFDARAFSLPTRQETVDYLAWRQHDAWSNTLSMTAGAHFSARELHGVSAAGKTEMLASKNVAVDSTPLGFRRGRVIIFEERPGTTTYLDRRTKEPTTVHYVRRTPVAVPAPLFRDDDSLVPAGR